MRYFFFTYVCNSDDKTASGNIYLSEQRFPSSLRLKTIALDRNNGDFNMDQIAITGWNEFKTVEDFNDFIAYEAA